MKFVKTIAGIYIAVETIANFKELIETDTRFSRIEITTKRGEKHIVTLTVSELQNLIQGE